MIVTDARVVAYAEERLGRRFAWPYSCMGRLVGGEVVAAAVFTSWTGYDVEVSLAAERGGLSRAFLAGCADYVTRQLGCIRASITTEQERVARLVERLGGKREGLKRHAFGLGRHGIALGITRDEWRFDRAST